MFEESELPKDWILLADEAAVSLEIELKKEAPKGHILYGLECTALARHKITDDCLFKVLGADAPLYSVYLTGSIESDPFWPVSEPFESKEEFIHY